MIFALKKKKEFEYRKEMKRFLQIIPNARQSMINKSRLESTPSANDFNENNGVTPTLGVMAESLWNKKFKIRLTSKHTGKKIDINISFGKKV